MAYDLTRIAEKFGYSPDLLQRLVDTESSGNPRARSKKGAVGLTQLMPATAKEMGVKDRTDPEQSLHGGVGYLKKLEEKYGDLRTALVAYNWGQGNVDRHGVEKAPSESISYADKVLGGVKEQTGTNPYLTLAPTSEVRSGAPFEFGRHTQDFGLARRSQVGKERLRAKEEVVRSGEPSLWQGREPTPVSDFVASQIPFLRITKGEQEIQSPETAMEIAGLYGGGKFLKEVGPPAVRAGIRAGKWAWKNRPWAGTSPIPAESPVRAPDNPYLSGKGETIYRAGRPEGQWWSPDKEYVSTGWGGRKVQTAELPPHYKVIDEKEFGKFATPAEVKYLKDNYYSKEAIRKVWAERLERTGYDAVVGPEGTMESDKIYRSYFLKEPLPQFRRKLGKEVLRRNKKKKSE